MPTYVPINTRLNTEVQAARHPAKKVLADEDGGEAVGAGGITIRISALRCGGIAWLRGRRSLLIQAGYRDTCAEALRTYAANAELEAARLHRRPPSKQNPAREIRPGGIIEFQFEEFTDFRRRVKWEHTRSASSVASAARCSASSARNQHSAMRASSFCNWPSPRFDGFGAPKPYPRGLLAILKPWRAVIASIGTLAQEAY
jgi:hypothetical protein